MKGFASSRSIIAGTQRINARTVRNLLSHCQPGEGIRNQTCSGREQGFTAPIVTRQRANGTTIYFVESDAFKDRYFSLYQQNGAWVLVGESDNSIDRAHKKQCVAKVKVFLAEAAAQEVAAPVAEVVAAAPRRSAPPDIHCGSWRGVSVFISDAEMAEIRARVRAATPPDELARQDKEDAWLAVWAEVERIEQRWRRENAARRIVA